LADVVCIGAHVLDVIGGPVDELPGPGRAAIVDEIGITVAGTAGGVAIDLARHGVSVATVGVVGDDVAGRLMVSIMGDHGIDTDGIRVHPTLQTSMSMHAIGRDGERRPIHIVGANRSIELADLTNVATTAPRAVHFGGLDVMPQLWGQAPELVRGWRDSGAIVTLDVLGRPAGTGIDWGAVLTDVDWFLPNDAQLLQLSGTSTARDAATWALDRGVRHVVMTLGGDGALFATADEMVVVPARDVEVRDTTGCGDAVVGGLIAALLGGLDDVAAVELGVVAGSTTARGYGSDAGVAGLDALLSAARDLPVRRPSLSIDDPR
jgi:sugar/nucleoside kinase (ribokinase family)